MATDNFTQHFNELIQENKNISTVLMDLKENVGNLSSDEVIKQLKQLVSSTSDTKSVESLADSAKKIAENPEDKEKEVEKLTKSFSAKMKESLAESSKQMKKGMGVFTTHFSDALAPIKEVQKLTGGLFNVMGGVGKGIGKIPSMFKKTKEEEKKEPEEKDDKQVEIEIAKTADDKQAELISLTKGIADVLGVPPGMSESEKQQAALQEEQMKITQGISEMMEDTKKDKERETKPKKEGEGLFGGLFEKLGGKFVGMLTTALLGLVFAIGAGAGGIVASVMVQFKVVFGGLGLVFKPLIWVMNQIPVLQRLFAPIVSGFNAVKGVFGSLLSWFTGLFSGVKGLLAGGGKFAKILGTLLKGFKFGLKVFGWPINILMGVIDFIKGFTSTEGSLADKMAGGLTAAIWGFIELPVKLIGWVVDWVLGLFGVKITGGLAGLVKEYIGKYFSWFANTFSGVFEAIGGFFMSIFDFFRPSNLMGILTKAAGYLVDPMSLFNDLKVLPGKLWDWISTKITGMVDWFFGLFSSGESKGDSKESSWLTGLITDFFTFPSKIGQWLGKKVWDIFSFITKFLSGSDEEPSIFAVITTFFLLPQKIGMWLGKKVLDIFSFITKFLSGSDEEPSVFAIITTFFFLPQKIFLWLGKKLSDVVKKITEYFSTDADGNDTMFGKVVNGIKEIWSSISEWFSSKLEWMKNKLSWIPGLGGSDKKEKTDNKQTKKSKGVLSSISSWFSSDDKEKEVETNEKPSKLKKSFQQQANNRVRESIQERSEKRRLKRRHERASERIKKHRSTVKSLTENTPKTSITELKDKRPLTRKERRLLREEKQTTRIMNRNQKRGYNDFGEKLPKTSITELKDKSVSQNKQLSNAVKQSAQIKDKEWTDRYIQEEQDKEEKEYQKSLKQAKTQKIVDVMPQKLPKDRTDIQKADVVSQTNEKTQVIQPTQFESSDPQTRNSLLNLVIKRLDTLINITNNGTGAQAPSEARSAPDEIEGMSLLLHNKNWGLVGA